MASVTDEYLSNAGPSRHFDQSPPALPPKSTSPSNSFRNGLSSQADNDGHMHGAWPNGGGEIPRPSSGADNHDSASRRNPLVDLIDSEKTYVEQLGLVIRRVAAAWSRKDFPPPKLDTMFRAVEAVYRANRAFGNKLKEIGPNPSSPKALGDLLMRWIDDLEPSYSKYCSTFMSGFDSYEAVTRNVLLPNILTDISTISTPTPPLSTWSLDALFILPYARLRYYRKLYARLLRSTKEGRSDHKLLVTANQRLEALVSEVESRLDVDVAESDGAESADNEHQSLGQAPSGRARATDTPSDVSPFSRDDGRNSGESAATSYKESPTKRPPPAVQIPKMSVVPRPTISTPSSGSPLTDLELRIDPERTIDLFTMKLKKCKLQMNPPNLPFTRFLRSSHDVSVYFTPRCTGQQVVHQRAHVFILSDLFLMAEWMDALDKAAKAQEVAQEQPERVGQGGPMPEMWLSYPPLAGKHLSVAEGHQPNILTVTIMKKETFVIHAESEVARDKILHDLYECIDFAASTAARRGLPSPVDARSPSSFSDHRSADGHMPPFRQPSPFSADSSPSVSPRPSDVPHIPPPTMQGNALVSQMHQLSLEPGEIAPGRGPSPLGDVASPPPRGASLSGRTRVPSMPDNNSYGFQPGQVVPGATIPRSASGRSVQSAPRPLEIDPAPPLPIMRGPGSHYSDGSGASWQGHAPPSRSKSAEPLRPLNAPPPSARYGSFASPLQDDDDDSPPMSPVEEEAATLTGPAIISAQMKCKVFLKQSHQQWKALGSGRLKLYAQAHGNVKQLVVESDSSSKAMLISTIVLTDGVERVAKTGVAVEISDKGKRTGIIYMIQLRNENSAAGLFESLLAGSDRSTNR
ncbi:hypothetical protein BD324DRAFT_643385 [Kockovaella imperatae]|uniref:DH domain-containing protein n=1 Tax=Kockovaella imperatae TaxID=4999 RepID=A0A1Y1U8P0_9TREE|nr:hypothetical protein BD324DRAFT_643385 [Kockovaella imperatae]ORX34393.1 hypothetical protein BD324DRAFT_643385 [Kockovaella imperatae]